MKTKEIFNTLHILGFRLIATMVTYKTSLQQKKKIIKTFIRNYIFLYHNEDDARNANNIKNSTRIDHGTSTDHEPN